MDNLSSHKSAEVARLIESVGAQFCFLPADSPDLSPIEALVSKRKQALRSAKARTFPTLIDAMGEALRSVSRQDILGWFAMGGYQAAPASNRYTQPKTALNANLIRRLRRFASIPQRTPAMSEHPTLPRGMDLVDDPLLNKDTAFSEAERDAFGLHGLLPPDVETIDQQVARAYEGFQAQDTDLKKHIYLRALQDRNETLHYALLQAHIQEMNPIVYDPVVAQAIEQFVHIYRRPRGLFLSYPLRAKMREMIANRPHKEVDAIVVTDGERILGIHDQGVGGMGISIGKLALYTLMGGIAPERCLPICLDVGTNNEDRLNDPRYFGWKHRRIDEADYRAFIDEFVQAIQAELPDVLLQWEDFAKPHARPILDKYQDQLCTFNDDIQGTAAVVLGAAFAAMHVTNSSMKDQTIVILGAGGAGTGIASYLLEAMKQDGLAEDEARRRFYLVDVDGLLVESTPDLSPVQKLFAQPDAAVRGWKWFGKTITLADVVKHVQATMLIGVSTTPDLFTKSIVQEMASKVDRPIIFPLSNPTEKAEAKAPDLIAWTDGKALVATGIPVAPVTHNGKSITIGQANNFFIFPAIGLAVAATKAKRVTDPMMVAAARALGRSAPAINDPTQALLPPLAGIREVMVQVAVAAAEAGIQEGHIEPTSPAELTRKIRAFMWNPAYRDLLADHKADQ